MKVYGPVRKIDDLGRITIPKEYRNTLNVREGDELEILLTDEGVLMKKTLEKDTVMETLEYLKNNLRGNVTEEQRQAVEEKVNQIRMILV